MVSFCSAWADNTSLAQNVDGCNTLNTTGANYLLTTNVTSTGTCFTISAQNITLDCRNNWINYSTGGTTGTNGVYTQFFNTTVKNCNIIDGNWSSGVNTRYGIYFNTNDNSTLFNNFVNVSNASAIYLYNLADYNNLTNNTAIGNLVNGIYIFTSSNNNLTSNTELSNSSVGIYLGVSSNNNILINNFIRSNFSFGISVYNNSNNSLTLTNVQGTYGYSITGSSNIIVSDCVYVSGSLYDVYLNSGNTTFTNCSYNSENVGSTGYLYRNWYFDANVTFTNGTIFDNVNLTMYNASQIPVFSSLTDSDGNIDRVELTEYTNTGNTLHNKGPYNLKLSKDGYYNNSRFYDITNNTFDSIKYYLPFSITFPYSNLKQILQRNINFNITGNLSGNIEGYSNVKNFTVEYSGTTSGKFYFTQFSNESFNLPISLNAGVYNLNIYDSDNPNVSMTLSNIYVGDIILVLGQSNAVSAAYPAVSYSPNWPILTAVAVASSPPDYNSSTPTKIVPMTNVYRDAGFAYNISLTENTPVMVLNFAVGGSAINSWQNYSSDDYYNIAINHVRNYTQGTMNIKSIYWYQGESDIAFYNDTLYYNNFSKLVNNSFEDMNIVSGKFVTGQILKGASDSADPTLVRKAQQDAWYNLPNVSRGPITYDIKMGVNQVHFDTTQNQREFAERMEKSILYSVYDFGENYPVVDSVYLINDTLLYVDFSKTGLEISTWNETTTNSIAKGVNLTNSTSFVDDASVVNMTLTNDILKIYFNKSISSMDNLTFCNGFSCYGQPVVRNSGNNLPMEIVFNKSITKSGQGLCEIQGLYWYSSLCNVNPQSTSAEEISGSSTAIYKPTNESLTEGYSRNFVKGQKIEITVDGEKEVITINKILENEVQFSVSGNNYSVAKNETKKFDLNSDGVYDLQISVEKIYTNGIAQMEFKLINEKIPSTEQTPAEEQTQNETPTEKNNNLVWIILSGIVLIGIIFVLIKIISSRKFEKKYGRK